MLCDYVTYLKGFLGTGKKEKWAKSYYAYIVYLSYHLDVLNKWEMCLRCLN